MKCFHSNKSAVRSHSSNTHNRMFNPDPLLQRPSLKPNNLRLKLLMLASTACVFFGSVFLVQASVSVTSVLRMKGSKPYLLTSDGNIKVRTLDQLMGFEMPKQDGSSGNQTIDASMAGNLITVNESFRFNQITSLVPADGQLHDLTGLSVGDDEGDAADSANTSVTGQMKLTWYNGQKPITDLNQTLSHCQGPYQLRVEIPSEVTVNTKYGDPNTNSYGTSDAIVYSFFLADDQSARLCYVQPYNHYDFYNMGYNPLVWIESEQDETRNGFKPDVGFPTTGFKGARFNLIGTGDDQSKFRCTSTNAAGKITLMNGDTAGEVGEGCSIFYESEKRSQFIAGGTPTIDMQYNTGTGWEKIASYNIPVPSKWAVSPSQLYLLANVSNIKDATEFQGMDQCRLIVDGSLDTNTTREQMLDLTPSGKAWRQKYLYRRDEYNNSTEATDPAEGVTTSYAGWGLAPGSRDIGRFVTEWGQLDTYSNSVWVVGSPTYIWTSEISSDSNTYISATLYTVSTYIASFAHRSYANDNKTLAVCRGDNL